MKIKNIKVTKLFGLKGNNFDIDLYPKSPVSIIFALNGVGKTSLIRLVDAALPGTRSLFLKGIEFFTNPVIKYTVLDKILFENLTLTFDNEECLTIKRCSEKDGKLKKFDETFISELPHDKDGFYLPITYIWKNKDGSLLEGKFYFTNEISEKLSAELKTNPESKKFFFTNEETKSQTYLSEFATKSIIDDEKDPNYREIFSINKLYSLASNIILANREYNRISSGFVERYKNQILTLTHFETYELDTVGLSPKDIIHLYNELKEKQNSGRDINFDELFINKFQDLTTTYIPYTLPDKVSNICQEIVNTKKTEKDLEEFLTIINDNFALTDKYLVYNEEKGLIARFYADSFGEDAPDLDVSKLSAGEKNLISLFYELIFKNKKNSLIFIDEPEASLHIDWQRILLKNISKICEKKNIQAIVTTHSPSIVSNFTLMMSEMLIQDE
ncbi:MAG: ATP-binding protein [Treponema sp.]|nr:ATP-binding protein [Treponema sp.]